MNKTTAWIIVIVVVVLLGIWYFAYQPAAPTTSMAPGTTTNTPSATDNTGNATPGVSNNSTTSQGNPTNSQIPNGQGRVVFSVSDATTTINNVSEISATVSGVEVHQAGDGWSTVSTAAKTYDLLALNQSGQPEILSDLNLKEGTYDQIRFNMDKVVVKLSDGTSKTAKLPSGKLTLKINLVVKSGQTSSLNLDFLADKAIHVTGNGDYIFAPVIRVQSKSNTDVSVGSDNVVSENGGTVDKDETFGMDVDGSLKSNFQINTTQKLGIDSKGKIIKL